MSGDIVVVSAVRTPVGNFGGVFKDINAVDLAETTIRGLFEKVGLKPKTSEAMMNFTPEKLEKGYVKLEEKYQKGSGEGLKEVQVDEVILGQVLQAGLGQNPARQATLRAGIPKEASSYLVNHLCASGLKSVLLGAQAIQRGDAEVCVCGGMESMSTCPYSLPKARFGYRMDVANAGAAQMHDLLVHDGLWEQFYDCHMGETAENIAALYGISRADQDALALESHKRAVKAIDEGNFKEEIIPVPVPAPRRGAPPTMVAVDEKPSRDTTLEKLAQLRPVFRTGGCVTAGNASGINDAAAAVLLMTRGKAESLGLKPLATLRSYATAGVDPAYMGLGVIPATRKALAKAGLRVEDIQVAEVNEAFAAQALACVRELKLNPETTNVNGSGISIGHPIGCTGARCTVSLLHEMERRDAKVGLVTLCVGGGQGIAAVFSRP